MEHRLAPNPAHVLMPSMLDLQESGDNISFVGSWNRSRCQTCDGEGHFRGYISPLTDEIGDVVCDCEEQLVLARWMAVRGIERRYQLLRRRDMGHGLSEDGHNWFAAYIRKDNFRWNLNNGIGALLHGSAGSGKTGIAVLLLKRYLEEAQDGMLVHADRLSDNANRWSDPERLERWWGKVY